MRLSAHHPPPERPATVARCRYLEALLEAAVGWPLGPAAALLGSERDRGRHGAALQWHLGLEPWDNSARPDWEGRIELKLLTVWRRKDGSLACDKVKVCDATIDPWRKLANVAWVYVDRVTRCVVGHAFTTLGGPLLESLAHGSGDDPYFGDPQLFIEERKGSGPRGGVAPAYYVTQRWLTSAGLLDRWLPGVFGYDPRAWRALRARHRGGEPLLTGVTAGGDAVVGCPRCGGPIEHDPAELSASGAAIAHHGWPVVGECALRPHVVVDVARLAAPALLSPDERRAALEATGQTSELSRICELVLEPDDHGHD